MEQVSTLEAIRQASEASKEYTDEQVKKNGITEDEVKAIVNTATEGKATRADKLQVVGSFDGYLSGILNGNEMAFFASLSSAPRSIPIRDHAGRMFVATPDQDTHVTNKKYVDDADIANANKIADNTKRIENLESTLLTFIEDGESAYEKTVPVGVGKNAVLSSIGGATKVSKNLLDPSLFNAFETVNEDGSVRFIVDLGSGGSDFRMATVTLPAGTYYISGYDNVVKAPESGSVQGYSFNNPYTSNNTITLGETTDVEVFISFDGVGIIETDVYVMISTEPDAEFEPYFEGERYGKVTAVENYGSNRFNPQWLIDYVDDYHKKNIEPYGNGVKVSGYPCKTNISFAKFMELTGLKVGDTFTTLCKMRRADDTDVTGTRNITFESGGDSTWLDVISNTVQKITITENMLKYQTFNIYVAGTTTNNPVYITDITVVKANTITDYMPYSAEPIDTFTIPSEIQAINGYGKDGFVLDLERKTATYKSEVADVSAYLTDYENFKFIAVQGGGKVRFVNGHELAVPSEIDYVKAKE